MTIRITFLHNSEVFHSTTIVLEIQLLKYEKSIDKSVFYLSYVSDVFLQSDFGRVSSILFLQDVIM